MSNFVIDTQARLDRLGIARWYRMGDITLVEGAKAVETRDGLIRVHRRDIKTEDDDKRQ